MEAIHTEEYKGYNIEIYYDEFADNPFELDEGLGNFFHWKENGKEQLEKYCELLGYDIDTRDKIRADNKDAIRIDKYEHSGISYSVENEGRQCRFDTSNSWAVWVPNDCLMEELKGLKGKKRREKCIQFAREACEVFNDWANGNIYGFKITKNGEIFESCWGFSGDYEESGLIEEAKSIINHLAKEEKKLQLQY